MVVNFVVGGVVINVFCCQFGWQFEVVDVGIFIIVYDKSVYNQCLGEIIVLLNIEMVMFCSYVEKGFELVKQ